jgi:hypothetical protein
MDKPPQKPEEARFYVTVSNEVQGPYDLDFIEAMVLSGIYLPDVSVCKEGSEVWNSLGGVRPATLPAEPTQVAPVSIRCPTPSKSNRARNVLIGGGGIAFIVILFAVIKSSTPASKTGYEGYDSSATATPSPFDPDAYLAQKRSEQAGPWTKYAPSKGSDYPATATPSPFDPDAYLAQKRSEQAGPWTEYTANSGASNAHYAKFDGKTYRVSDSDNDALLLYQYGIESKARALQASKSDEKELGDEIEGGRTYVVKTDQNAVDRFNEKVNRYNALSEQIDRQVQEYNALVDSYNAKLVRVGTPVQ